MDESQLLKLSVILSAKKLTNSTFTSVMIFEVTYLTFLVYTIQVLIYFCIQNIYYLIY